MKNYSDAAALRHQPQVATAARTGRLLPLLLCFVMCALSMRAENRPSKVFFHYDAGTGWKYNQQSTNISDSWFVDVVPTNSDVYMVMTNKSISNTAWNNLTGGKSTVFYGSEGNKYDKDSNWIVGYNTSKPVYLYYDGPGHCIHISGCPTGKALRFKLSYSNGNLTFSSYAPDYSEVTLYMHFEEDFLKQGNGNGPWCHVFNTNGAKYKEWQSNEAKMKCVNETYQIWAYSLPAYEAEKYNRVNFSFNLKDGGQANEYESGCGESSSYFDAANWSKYIYAVHSDKIAVQTYLTYDDFLAEAQKGYRNLYVTGGGDDGAKIKLTQDDGTETYLGWDPAIPTVVPRWKEDEPLFFMRYVPTMANDNARFKLSWMDVATYKVKNAGQYQHKERDWATYDLGIIGVNDVMCEENKDKWGENLVKLDMAGENGWSTSRTSFFVNKALPLLEYNQYDWTMNQSLSGSGVTNEGTYWVVVDMHPSCRTVTLCSFDPHPQVRVNASQASTISIGADVVASIYNGGHCDHFGSAEANGHILTTQVNQINGSVNIIGGKDKDGKDVESADFEKLAKDAKLHPTYTVSMNGGKLFEYEGLPQTLKIDNMPLAAENSIDIEAMYTSEVTGLQFHVKPGNGTVTTQAAFVAPKDQEVEGTFVPFYEYPGKKGNGNITEKEYRATFHICGETPYELDGNTDLAYYPDFALDQKEIGLMHDDYRPWLDIPGNVTVNSVNHTKFNHQTDTWDAASHDWSTKIKNDGSFPYIVYNHHKCNISGAMSVPAADYTGKLYAIYPVLYRLEPTVTVANDKEGAPRRAAEVIDAADYGLVNYVTEGNLHIKAAERNVTTGVEDILAEDDAAAAEYYTLQGVRVEGTPAPGLYIRVQGNTAVKVYVR